MNNSSTANTLKEGEVYEGIQIRARKGYLRHWRI